MDSCKTPARCLEVMASRCAAPQRAYGLPRRLFNLAAGVLALGLATLPPGAAQAAELVLLAFGDSLTAGYGLPAGEGFTDVLEKRLRERGLDVTVRDGGVSGDTTSGGRSRLEWALQDDVDAVLLELGANDALRGIDPAIARDNLSAMLETLRRRDLPVLLAGMRAPPNMGRAYAAAFERIYPDLAERHGVPLYPFFLDGVAADARLNQSDGIHPNAAGVEVIVERILPAVVSLLERAKAAS